MTRVYDYAFKYKATRRAAYQAQVVELGLGPLWQKGFNGRIYVAAFHVSGRSTRHHVPPTFSFVLTGQDSYTMSLPVLGYRSSQCKCLSYLSDMDRARILQSWVSFACSPCV